MANEIIELFGKRVRIIETEGGAAGCDECIFQPMCSLIEGRKWPCDDASGNSNRYFKPID